MSSSGSQSIREYGCIGLVAAFWWEVKPLLRKRPGFKRWNPNLYSFPLAGEPVVLAIGGVGVANSSRAAQHLVEQFAPRALVSLGYAGALGEPLAPGDLILAEQVVDGITGNRFNCQTGLLPLRFHRPGILLCMNEVVASAAEKQRLGRRWGAVAVDMESAGVAQTAARAGLPFAALKSITDSAKESISIDFMRCQSEHKRLSFFGIIREALRVRGGTRELWQLARSSRQAASNLAAAFRAAETERLVTKEYSDRERVRTEFPSSSG